MSTAEYGELRNELKAWERAFKDAQGRAPTKDDMKTAGMRQCTQSRRALMAHPSHREQIQTLQRAGPVQSDQTKRSSWSVTQSVLAQEEGPVDD